MKRKDVIERGGALTLGSSSKFRRIPGSSRTHGVTPRGRMVKVREIQAHLHSV